jgi:hypothetical protein
LRSEMRAEAIRARSIAAMRRLNREVEGASAKAAVLDIVVPFPESGRAASLSGDNLCIPDARYNLFVCIAAIWRLHCNI